MSHFVGLVILTPKYALEHTLEDALDKYYQGIEVDKYLVGEVSDFKKLEFIFSYNDFKYSKSDMMHDFHIANGGNAEVSDYCFAKDNEDKFVKFVLSKYPDILDDDEFLKLYEQNGKAWNAMSWELNAKTKKWEEWSTYNPHSKWDWYVEGGRWGNFIKTKEGKYVNSCKLSEIDWAPYSEDDYEEELATSIWGEKYKKLKEGVNYHLTKNNPPFSIIIDGEWHEKGEMGYWGITTNEMSDEEWNELVMKHIEELPEDSMCYNIDFHI